ncbi:CRISPR-associated helicase Cas3' [Pseudodesulfovibrio sp. JC047]|uniref:CRISPR-associated helicase Cas3' n=1 Tax=Pseudodesulfovibrio sp. JC047 TaxID=2683199 RepID=UPI0013D2B689|nr:CRISPR-associated helicase Cas3' [Pseudodesulfovibrio sp. JC047]NDV19072.1 CRISPR-associated helicase Cas3' [Pseudodesulfovibrio sp. JC047]
MHYYAHTKEDSGPETWQSLDDHLQNVARLTAQRCRPFNAEEWGRLIGATHDIGKKNPLFQKRLTGENRDHADHKGAGASLMASRKSQFGHIAALCIGGHHGGLPDYHGNENGRSLKKCMKEGYHLSDDEIGDAADFEDPTLPFVPRSSFECAFFTRMLFSALVDADFLDTEAFMDAKQSGWRKPGPSLAELAEALDRRLASFDHNGRINALRAEILAHCRAKASLEPGLFTLTVPTGGGKTLTSMAFALDHARIHHKRRVIYVVPYTSIIEQNARVFRDIFPANTVIEHQSTFDGETIFDREDNAQESSESRRHRLACENWDSPVVVTTNVQFFESLFASKTSKCRKLHNLSDAVIVLDEVQMLPVEFMTPCLRAIEELASHYGASVVLCTATQPALRKEDFAVGLSGLTEERELAPDPKRMHEAFRRTTLHKCGEVALDAVAAMVREREQVLCIVNTRGRAAELFDMVRGEPGALHLSAVMCPAHRSRRLNDIRAALAAGESCRVVSTQLVEAGVDVSFPEVIREIAGLDSITQAAGRCNREGESDELAPVHVFQPTEGLPQVFKSQAHHTETVLRQYKDAFSPDAMLLYFSYHYWLQQDLFDKKHIMKLLSNDEGEWKFKQAAQDFRLIDSPMVPIIIPYDERAEELVRSLHYVESPGAIQRELQQYTVQIYTHQLEALDAIGAVEFVADTYAVLSRQELYDDQLGLTFPKAAQPEDFLA